MSNLGNRLNWVAGGKDGAGGGGSGGSNFRRVGDACGASRRNVCGADGSAGQEPRRNIGNADKGLRIISTQVASKAEKCH